LLRSSARKFWSYPERKRRNDEASSLCLPWEYLPLAHGDSAGTAAYHVGNPPDPRAIAEAASRGIDISDLRARQVEPADFDQFDLIVAMDRSNLANLQKLAPRKSRAALRLMLPGRDVPDPYYDGGFEQAYDLLNGAMQDLLADLRG